MSALPHHSSTTDMPQHLPQYALSAELSCNNDCNPSEVPLDTTDQAAICRQRADSRKGKQQLQYNNLVDSLESAQHENLVLRESLRAETSRTDFLRRMLVLLGSLTALLALSNIGASFAAARLAQSSTQVNVYGDWTDAQGHRLGTTDKQVVFEMYPIEEHHRRHLQQESFICNSGVNGTNCDLQGIIHYEDAAALYEQFCPTQTNGFCSGGGVKEVELMCNGHLSTLFGGHLLPDGPPTMLEDSVFMVYPSLDAGYLGEAAAFLNGQLYPCVQQFRVGMYCPTPEAVAQGEPSDCLVFLWWLSTCPGVVDLCGVSASTH